MRTKRKTRNKGKTRKTSMSRHPRPKAKAKAKQRLKVLMETWIWKTLLRKMRMKRPLKTATKMVSAFPYLLSFPLLRRSLLSPFSLSPLMQPDSNQYLSR